MTIVVTSNDNTRITNRYFCNVIYTLLSLNPPLPSFAFNSPRKKSKITPFIPYLYIVCFIIFLPCNNSTIYSHFPHDKLLDSYYKHPWYTFTLYYYYFFLFHSLISIEWHVLQVWRNLCVSFNLITQFPFFFSFAPSLFFIFLKLTI